jgi:hypothetical protein
MVAHFDVTTKKYIVSTVVAPHADYATAYTKFIVVAQESDTEYSINNKAMVRFETQM